MNRDQLLAPIAALLEAQGLSVGDLVAFQASQGVPSAGSSGPVLSDFAHKVHGGLLSNTANSYRTHFDHLLRGVSRQCHCTCATCVAEFTTARTCLCACPKCAKASAFPGQGDLVISAQSVSRIDLDLLVKLIQQMAIKRAMGENVVRARRGLSPKPTHGQGAREMCVSALRCLFQRMVDEQLITGNPAQRISKGRRSEPQRRALSDVEITQVFETAATGGNDPELDFLLTWAEFELGARRNGILTLAVGRLDSVAQTVGLWEKGNKIDSQPCSLELIETLLAFARSRGGAPCNSRDPSYNPNAAVFYFKDSTAENPHAVTSRRFDTLHKRIQLVLPWANSASYTGHALRHTVGTMVERIAGFETAKRMLRHAGTGPTDTYVKAGLADVARAIAEITGWTHPLVPPPYDCKAVELSLTSRP